jgi:hypothetical protein
MEDPDSEIAQLIAGEEPPGWVVGAVRSARRGLTQFIEESEQLPRRAELRADLEAIEKGAEMVLKGLSSPLLRWRLHLGGVWGEHQLPKRIEDDLRVLSGAARVWKEGVRDGRGPDKTRLFPDTPSALESCAAIVAMLWERARKREVPVTNEDAWRACSLLWAAAGGKSRHWGNTLAGWRKHLCAAKKRKRLPAAPTDGMD